MPGYRSEVIAFEAPDDWEDKTIVAFSAPPQPGKFSPNVVMTKDTLKSSETLRSYADRQIMELARRLEGFELVESGDRDVGGRPAMEYRFTWKSEHAELHQHSVILAVGTQILSFTGTAIHDDEGALEEAMQRVLGSVKYPAAMPGYSPTGGAPPPAPVGGGYSPGGWERR
jgi:hypothetical protein